MRSWRRLGEVLVSEGFLSEAIVNEAIERAVPGVRIGEHLVERGLLSETQLAQALAHQLSLPWVSINHVDFRREILDLLPSELATRHRMIPVYVQKARGQAPILFVAMSDPTDEEALRAAAEHTNGTVRAMVAGAADLVAALRFHYAAADSTSTAARDEAPPAPKSDPASVDGKQAASDQRPSKTTNPTKHPAPPLPHRAKMPSITSEMHAATTGGDVKREK